MSMSYVYMADPRLDFRILARMYTKPLDIQSIVKNIHWQQRKREHISDFKYELPATRAFTAKHKDDTVQRVRLVYKSWKDTMDYPKITKRLYNQTITLGRNGRLEVHVSGHPEPEVRWYRNNRPVVPSKTVRMYRVNSNVYVLLINDAEMTDQGLYTVRASNLVGSTSTSAYVHVEKYNSRYNPHRVNVFERLRYMDTMSKV